MEPSVAGVGPVSVGTLPLMVKSFELLVAAGRAHKESWRAGRVQGPLVELSLAGLRPVTVRPVAVLVLSFELPGP